MRRVPVRRVPVCRVPVRRAPTRLTSSTATATATAIIASVVRSCSWCRRATEYTRAAVVANLAAVYAEAGAQALVRHHGQPRLAPRRGEPSAGFDHDGEYRPPRARPAVHALQRRRGVTPAVRPAARQPRAGRHPGARHHRTPRARSPTPCSSTRRRCCPATTPSRCCPPSTWSCSWRSMPSRGPTRPERPATCCGGSGHPVLGVAFTNVPIRDRRSVTHGTEPERPEGIVLEDPYNCRLASRRPPPSSGSSAGPPSARIGTRMVHSNDVDCVPDRGAARRSPRARSPGGSRHASATPVSTGCWWLAAIAHLVFSWVQLWVVDHVYHGITDYNRYINQGAILARRFDHFNFATGGIQPPVKVLGAGLGQRRRRRGDGHRRRQQAGAVLRLQLVRVPRHHRLLPRLSRHVPRGRSPPLRRARSSSFPRCCSGPRASAKRR